MAGLPPEERALTRDLLRRSSAELGVQLSDQQASRLVTFANLLQKWNRVYNLTAIESLDTIVSHHLLDALSIVPELERRAGGREISVLDVGSGGGLPGLPIAIALPSLRVTLIDRVQKKTAFIQQAILELGLRNTEVVHARVEQYRAPGFDVIVSRAFAALAEMVRLTSHLLAEGGCWFAMKGAYSADEVGALPQKVKLAHAVKLRVPLLGAERHLLILGPR